MGNKKKQALKSLKSGRPPLVKSSRSMSRRASRSLINKHHQLEKQRVRATRSGDKATEIRIVSELAGLGGLDQYQKASLQGQSIDRGGDTSKVLLEWLPIKELKSMACRLRMLEIGALSTRNACSMSGIFQVEHIDLNSQEPGIKQQDFMKRPLPDNDDETFDILSLSLVINFVPDAAARGRMLQRTLSFLKSTSNEKATNEPVFPCLFLVLPRSCVDNSRYFTDQRLQDIMAILGYEKIRAKKTQKLDYSLWRKSVTTLSECTTFKKQEVNPGRARNNFVITLHGQTV